jgi:hypothetical protein
MVKSFSNRNSLPTWLIMLTKEKQWRNDATSERLERASEADLDSECIEFVSAAGKLERRRQILCTLDTLEKRGTISSIQRDAGKMYLSIVDQATSRARVTMAYHVGIDNSHSNFDLLDFIELKTDAFRSAKSASLAVIPNSRLALGWLTDTLAEEKKISSLGAMYAGHQTHRAQEERGLAILKLALDCLAHHFRLADLQPRTPEIKRWRDFLDQNQ